MRIALPSSWCFGLRFRLLRRAIQVQFAFPLTCVTVVAFRFSGLIAFSHREMLRSLSCGSFFLAIFSRSVLDGAQALACASVSLREIFVIDDVLHLCFALVP